MSACWRTETRVLPDRLGPTKVAVTGSDGSVETYTARQLSLMDYKTLTSTLAVPLGH